jgi:hypothetical protein
MSDDKPPTPAGWYPSAKMVDTVRYWDGEAWTEHYGPAGNSEAASDEPADDDSGKVPCAYCNTPITAGVARCPQCAGDFKYCSRCKDMVALTTNSKFVGMARGGTKTQYRCARCAKVLEGPKF